jgi:hypothetical protein
MNSIQRACVAITGCCAPMIGSDTHTAFAATPEPLHLQILRSALTATNSSTSGFEALRESQFRPTFRHWGIWLKTRGLGLLVCKIFKTLVGERGFEPPTPLSRTRFHDLLKPVEIAWK